ncbi:MAG: hypothetical protein AB7G15_15935 [Alphaproteobacteria bacterium]
MKYDRDTFMERVGPKLMGALALLAAGTILLQVAMVFAAPFLL